MSRPVTAALLAALLLLAGPGCRRDAPEEAQASADTTAIAPSPALPEAAALYDCVIRVERGGDGAIGQATSSVSLDEACALAHRAACTNATTAPAEAAACLAEQEAWAVTDRTRDKRIRR